jgi:hypothetical protein
MAVRGIGVLSAVAAIGLAAPDASAWASPSTSPYSAGTLFVADQNCSCVWKVLPNQSPQVFEGANESPQDVVLDAAGDLFWTEANDGAVNELTAGGTFQTLASGVNPWGIGVDQTGDVYFGSFSPTPGLYEIPSGGGSPTLVTSQFGVWTSVAVDGDGDIWGAGGSANLVMVPHGSTTGVVVTVPGVGYINGVRFDANNDLFVSTGFNDVAAEVAAGSTSTTTFGSGLGYTEGVAVDASGNVFVGQSSTVPGFGEVWKISGGTQSVYASGQIATTGGLALAPALSPGSRTATTTTLSTTSPSTVTTQESVQVTATLSSTSATGAVQFNDNGQPVGGLVPVSGGVAQLTTQLPKGTNQITAAYLGDATDAPSVSNSLSFTANPITTRTRITAPDGTTVPGTSDATVDARVTGARGTPRGSVDFYVNGRYTTSGSLDNTGRTSVSFPLKPGTDRVTATYNGDSVFNSSHSTRLTFTTTTPYNPGMSTYLTYGPPNVNNAVRARIKVTVTGLRNLGAPTGTVTADSRFTCTALTPIGSTLKSTATCSHLIPFGTFEDVTVSYSGDSTYAAASNSVSIENGGG